MVITLKNLHKATAIEVFNQVKAHLLKQNAKCVDAKSKVCKYKRYNSYCAAGCLIGDDRLAKKFDRLKQSSWSSLIEAGHIPNNPHNKLIRELQEIHDDYYPWSWKDQLDLIEIRLKKGNNYVR